MTDTKEPERRKHERLQIEHGAFVILKSYDKKVGRIADISPDGLTFIYHTSGEGSAMATELDIFVVRHPSFVNHTAMWYAIWDAEAGPDISAQLFDATQHHTGGEG
ncbi:MAG: hypothetical protein JRF64_12300 [Deltaproteobacteria bacterium]|nr:hypothetical protein [Deltaproteobacteria bacterium]